MERLVSPARRAVRPGGEVQLAGCLAVSHVPQYFVREVPRGQNRQSGAIGNVNSRPFSTSPEGLYRQTIYHPLRLLPDICRPSRWIQPWYATKSSHADLPAEPRPARVADLGPFGVLDVAPRATPTVVS